MGLRRTGAKRFRNPQVGDLDPDCQVLLDPEKDHSLLVFTATPGSESHERLRLLAVVGAQALA